MSATDRLRLDVQDGKYTIVQSANGSVEILRFRQPWISDAELTATNCILAMAFELQELRAMTAPAAPVMASPGAVA